MNCLLLESLCWLHYWPQLLHPDLQPAEIKCRKITKHIWNPKGEYTVQDSLCKSGSGIIKKILLNTYFTMFTYLICLPSSWYHSKCTSSISVNIEARTAVICVA